MIGHAQHVSQDSVGEHNTMRWSESVKLEGRCGSKISIALLLVLAAAIAHPAEFPSADISDYRVDTGDRVSVIVYQEPDLSVTGVRVKANGTISYPLLGNLRVSGLTSQQVHDLVKERLLDGYLRKPSITVSIDSYRLYFIKGEVNRPGGYTFVDGLTVAKAVALAGGYTVRASQNSISLVRESDPENPIDSVGPNTSLRPGDIVTVGESFF